jgi:hypothetical protein
LDPFIQKIYTDVMSSSRDPQNDEGDGEVEEEKVVAMDTAAVAATTTTEATSIWDLARQNSSKMVLQSVMDDMEHRAAKQKEELQQFRRRAEDAEASLLSSRQTIEQLEASLLQHGETTKGLEKNVREASGETEVLKESIENEKERADRSGAESDRLREEIRYVLCFALVQRRRAAHFRGNVHVQARTCYTPNKTEKRRDWKVERGRSCRKTNVVLLSFACFLFLCKSNIIVCRIVSLARYRSVQ